MKRASKPIVVKAGEGRVYPMGRMTSIFKADGKETGNAYSVSEWWMEPNTKGPHAHENDEDHVWYVIEGTMSVLVGKEWFDAPKGTYIVIPGGLVHTFENRSAEKAGILNFNMPGGFEEEVPHIAKWFVDNPPGDAQ